MKRIKMYEYRYGKYGFEIDGVIYKAVKDVEKSGFTQDDDADAKSVKYLVTEWILQEDDENTNT